MSTSSAPRRSSNIFDATPFTPKLVPNARPHDSLAALDALISASDLSVVFQPIVHGETHEVFAYEALVRCKLPAFSPPPRLFERAQSDGCIGRLGRMIREVAVPLCSGSALFVNVHPQELQERWLVRPDDPLFSHDREVYLEITESVPMTHHSLCMGVLKEVCARGGMHIVVDDLGAGYSNLRRIADLEPAVVKLDKDLIEGIERSPRTRKLIVGVVRLCRDLGCKVVAEGIETVEAYEALLDVGVGLFQGYLFARPAFPMPGISEVPRFRKRKR